MTRKGPGALESLDNNRCVEGHFLAGRRNRSANDETLGNYSSNSCVPGTVDVKLKSIV